MNPQLTLLQRAVIQQLRQARLTALAEMASDLWSQGLKVSVQAIPALGEPTAQLQADFARANKQAH